MSDPEAQRLEAEREATAQAEELVPRELVFLSEVLLVLVAEVRLVWDTGAWLRLQPPLQALKRRSPSR
jgi:hypothetical protein